MFGYHNPPEGQLETAMGPLFELTFHQELCCSSPDHSVNWTNCQAGNALSAATDLWTDGNSGCGEQCQGDKACF